MKKIIAPIGLVFMCSGCATMFGGGGSQEVSIHSSKPVEVEVSYSNGTIINRVTAPATIEVRRKSKSLIIKSVNDEFDPVMVESETNGWAFANIVWGLFGLSSYTSTDQANGSAWRYEEDVTIPNIHLKESSTENQRQIEEKDTTTFKEIEE